MKASDKDIQMELNCDEDLQAPINPPLLEQAIINLLDNAIKYSPPGQTIHLAANRVNDEVVIQVRDHGCGIGREHLPRIFERFYRVDKARSRKLGGTGLGLAIVKHIAQAHGGRASVESTRRRGKHLFYPFAARLFGIDREITFSSPNANNSGVGFFVKNIRQEIHPLEIQP